MAGDERTVVLDHLVERDGGEVVDVHAGVEHPRTAGDQRPVVVPDVVVDIYARTPYTPDAPADS